MMMSLTMNKMTTQQSDGDGVIKNKKKNMMVTSLNFKALSPKI
jgi:hypothetical protein